MSELLQGPEAQDVDEDEGEQTAFKFAELSERAQQRAVEWWSRVESEEWQADNVLHDATQILELLGITVDARDANAGHSLKVNGRFVQDAKGNFLPAKPRYVPDFECWDIGPGGGVAFNGRWVAAELRLAELAQHVAADSPLRGVGAQMLALYLGHPQATSRILALHSCRLDTEIDHESFGLDDDDEGDERGYDIAAELRALFETCAQWVHTQLEEDYESTTSYEACREYLLEGWGDEIFDADGAIII